LAPADSGQQRLWVDAPEFALAGQDITVQATPADTDRDAIRVAVTSEIGRPYRLCCTVL
jgi:hypothetical protein